MCDHRTKRRKCMIGFLLTCGCMCVFLNSLKVCVLYFLFNTNYWSAVSHKILLRCHNWLCSGPLCYDVLISSEVKVGCYMYFVSSVTLQLNNNSLQRKHTLLISGWNKETEIPQANEYCQTFLCVCFQVCGTCGRGHFVSDQRDCLCKVWHITLCWVGHHIWTQTSSHSTSLSHGITFMPGSKNFCISWISDNHNSFVHKLPV